MCIFDISQLKCPLCGNIVLSQSFENIYCKKCSAQFPIYKGTLDFLNKKNIDTKLNVDTYDTDHSVNEKNAKSIFNIYSNNIQKNAGRPLNEVLEIGSGTGNLTYGLCKYSLFNKVHCSDISFRFIERLKKRIATVDKREKAVFYRLDANNLPFNDQSMDAVVGHSVLHHLAYFERTLESVFYVLREGGIAMFGEPILDSHAIISFVASLIVEADKNLSQQKISGKEKAVLESISSKAVIKRRNLHTDRNKLESIEDKFIFPIEYMRQISKEIGFRSIEVVQWAPVKDLGKTVKDYLCRIFLQNDIEIDVFERYNFIFNSLTNTYCTALNSYLSCPFGFFLLKK